MPQPLRISASGWREAGLDTAGEHRADFPPCPIFCTGFSPSRPAFPRVAEQPLQLACVRLSVPMAGSPAAGRASPRGTAGA